jgi:speckle-type POZ protein
MSFTGASVVADGRQARSQSPSAIAGGDASHGYHLLVVEGYLRTKSTPTGESFRSRPFMVGGYLWCIYYYPNGDNPDNAEFISVQLGLLHKDITLFFR